MDLFQKAMIKAMIQSKRYIYYFDVVSEMSDEKFQDEFETKDFTILKINRIEDIIDYLIKMYGTVAVANKFDELGIIVNDLNHLCNELSNENVNPKLRNQYMYKQMQIFMEKIKEFTIDGVPVYLVGKVNLKDEV